LSSRLPALVLVGLVLAAVGVSLGTKRQLGWLGGLTDEWVMLGANLAVHGTLGLEHEPWLLRPPGYPAFVALPLLLAGPPHVVTMAYLDRVEGLVAAAQGLALASAALLMFLWLRSRMGPALAFAAAATLGLHPVSLVQVGLLQYATLHVLGIVAGLWALDRALTAGVTRHRPLFLAGLVWGLVTLVRPVTLLLPPFVWLSLALRRPRPRLVAATAGAVVFSAGMAVAVSPWTARNYLVSGRFVPVNLQGRANFWAATVRVLPVDPDSYRWQALGADILRVTSRVTGRPTYDLLTYVKWNAELEEAFGREALANLRRQPGVFVANAVGNLRTLLFDTSTVLLPAFRIAQRTGGVVRAEWFDPGRGFEWGEPGLRAGVRVLWLALAGLSALGVWRAVRDRAGWLWPTCAVASCLLAVHVVTHMEMTYYYVRMPFLVALGFGGLASLPSRRVPVLGHRLEVANVAGAALALAAAALSSVLLRP
jgi:hypothetical protein